MQKSNITTNVRLTMLCMIGATLEYYNNPNYNHTGYQNDRINYDKVSEDISSCNTSDSGSEKPPYSNILLFIDIVTSVICIIGLVGNGIVIWLLGFHIEKNPFITYILNLAIADFGLLMTLIIAVVSEWLIILYGYTTVVFFLFFFLFLSMYSTSQFLLTVISIDRCVAVFFPLWHRCQRPPRLSTIVCAVIWVLSILLSAITCSNLKMNPNHRMVQAVYQMVVNSVITLPLMIAATVALFIKVCFIAQTRRGKPLTTILLALLFFLLLAFPLNVIYILYIYHYVPLYLPACATALSCINSSVNPVLYFLVGRQWRTGQRETMKMILQRVFKEE